MAGEYDFENLPVNVRRTDAGDSYQVGVVIHGKWFPFGGFTAPGFEADVQEALAAEQEAQRQAAAAAPADQQTPQPPQQ